MAKIKTKDARFLPPPVVDREEQYAEDLFVKLNAEGAILTYKDKCRIRGAFERHFRDVHGSAFQEGIDYARDKALEIVRAIERGED